MIKTCVSAANQAISDAILNASEDTKQKLVEENMDSNIAVNLESLNLSGDDHKRAYTNRYRTTYRSEFPQEVTRHRIN